MLFKSHCFLRLPVSSSVLCLPQPSSPSSSILCPPTSVLPPLLHPPSVLRPSYSRLHPSYILSSVLCPLSCPLSSVLRPSFFFFPFFFFFLFFFFSFFFFFVFRFPSSILRLPASTTYSVLRSSFVLRLQCFVLRPSSSILCQPSSVVLCPPSFIFVRPLRAHNCAAPLPEQSRILTE